MSSIAYKFVVKRNDLYYSLLNYGVDSKKIRNCPRYVMGGEYNSPSDFATLPNELGAGKGYHFFKTAFPKGYNYATEINYYPTTDGQKERLEKFINKHVCFKNPIVLTCLKCEIEDIVAENDNRWVARRFKILEEVQQEVFI